MGKGEKLNRRLFYAVHNVKEGLLNPVFWIAVILNTYVIFISHETDTSSTSTRIDLLEGIQSAFGMGIASYYVPICVSLPGVMGFFDEKASGAYRYKLLRNDRLIYVLKQVGKSMFSGAMVMFFSFVFYTLIMLLISLKNGVPAVFIGASGWYGEEGNTNIYMQLMAEGRGLLVYLMHGSFLMFSAMIWPAFGTAISAFVKNRKVALAFPFLLLRFWRFIISDETYFLETSNLRLGGSVMNLPLGGYVYAITYCLCVAFVCVVIVYTGLRILLRKNG